MINYDFPHVSEDYIHRIGRTGRSNQTGTAYTFFTRKNSKQANELISVLREANQEVDPKLQGLARSGKNCFHGTWFSMLVGKRKLIIITFIIATR